MKEVAIRKVKDMFKPLFALTLVLGFMSASSVGVFAQCDSGAIGELIKKMVAECKKEGAANTAQCVQDDSKLAKVARALNTLTGNGSLTIGPRYIEFGKNQDGTVQAPGNRTFVSGAPLEKNGASFSLTHHDGNAKLGVTVCKIDGTGKATRLENFTLDGSSMKDGETVSKSYSGLKGQFLQVFLDGQGVLKKFKLTFKATQN
jgi:hypothetical protein